TERHSATLDAIAASVRDNRGCTAALTQVRSAIALSRGSLVHGLYLGGAFTAISQGVSAGISALIPGLQSIMTSTIANRFMGEKLTRVQWVGLAWPCRCLAGTT